MVLALVSQHESPREPRGTPTSTSPSHSLTVENSHGLGQGVNAHSMPTMGDAGEDFDPQREKLSSGCWIRLSARSLPVLSITAHRRRRREAVGTAANAAEAAYQSRYIGKGPPASPPTGAHHSGPVGVAGLRQLHRSRANGEPWERKACRASPYTTRHRPVRAEGTRLRPACHASQSIGGGGPLIRLASARLV